MLNTAASLGIFGFGMLGRSRNDESSAKDVDGEDEAGLGGNWLTGGCPGGAGLRRDLTDSMAVKAGGEMS